MKGLIKRTVLYTFSFLLLLCAIPFPTTVGAAEAGHKVRVGWYNSDHFQEGATEHDLKSGYSYEYLQGVSNYTGWEYEYVSGGWSELYGAFIDGGIDLLAGLSYTEERASLMNYPGYEMGFEAYYIYKKAGNDAISGSDLGTLSGKRVGTLTNNLMTVFFESWMNETGADCEEVLFDDFQSRDDAFAAGEIDALIAVNNNVPSNSGLVPVVKVGESSYFLAVTKNRPDLLAELNQALTSINESNPYFTQSLQIKYFNNTAVNAALSPEESRWVAAHDCIQVGYLENYIPYCGADKDGQVSGVITDILDEWREQLGLLGQIRIEYRPYLRYTDMVAALQSGEIDTAFPVHDSIWISEQEGIVQTNDLVESSVHLVYRGEYGEKATTRKIAVSDYSAFQRNFVTMNYPESEILQVDSLEACLDAVKRGEATCTFFSSGQAEGFLSRSAYKSLSRLTLDENINYCMGVKKGNNVMYSLLSRGISLIDKSNMTNAMYTYMDSNLEYSLEDFIQAHIVLVLSIALVIIGLIVLVAIVLAISLKRAQKQQEKELEMLLLVMKQKEELVAAQESLREAVRQAEQASRAKTTFLFNMSHDIRTPMNAILGFADLAGKYQGDSEKLRDYLRKIRSSGSMLMSILNNVLEMARIEKGVLVLEEEVRGVEAFYGAMFDMFREQMSQKGIDFSKSVDVRHSYVYCDPAKLQEVLLNILSNACKYTDPGGRVSMSVEELPAGREDCATLRTTIRDTGRGMSADFLPKLFDEFAREKNSEKNTIEGTGLGMAIVKNLVDFMGGTVTVESKLGEGTSVTVTIPHRIAPADDSADAAADAPAQKDYTGKRILLAEDNDLNAEIISAVLEELGFEVERAEDGQICVERVKAMPAGYYDLILMDIQMPNVNGYEATQMIRALDDPGKASMPVLAVTANAFEEDRRDAFAAGMDGHLGKPIDVDALMTALSDTLKPR